MRERSSSPRREGYRGPMQIQQRGWKKLRQSAKRSRRERRGDAVLYFYRSRGSKGVAGAAEGGMESRERRAGRRPPYVEWVTWNDTEGAGFSGRYANKPLPDVSGVRFGLKLLLASSGIIVLDESLPAARHPLSEPVALILSRALPVRLLLDNKRNDSSGLRSRVTLERPGDAPRLP